MSYYTMAMDFWGGVGLFLLALPLATAAVRSRASRVERGFAAPLSLHHG
jgi:hypothetical protein